MQFASTSARTDTTTPLHTGALSTSAHNLSVAVIGNRLDRTVKVFVSLSRAPSASGLRENENVDGDAVLYNNLLRVLRGMVLSKMIVVRFVGLCVGQARTEISFPLFSTKTVTHVRAHLACVEKFSSSWNRQRADKYSYNRVVSDVP